MTAFPLAGCYWHSRRLPDESVYVIAVGAGRDGKVYVTYENDRWTSAMLCDLDAFLECYDPSVGP